MTHLIFAILTQSWSPNGLDSRLSAIAMIESSSGRNTKHAKHKLGIYWTAYGALGLKPAVAHEDYLGSTYARTLYPGLEDLTTFTIRLIFDVRFYNFACNLHFYKLISQNHDITDAIYIWRYGQTHAASTTREHRVNDTYVVKYFDLVGKGY